MSDADFENQTNLIFGMLGRSSPLINAYIIEKLPLLFFNQENNKISFHTFLNWMTTAKVFFIKLITDERDLVSSLLPLMAPQN